MSRGIAIGGVMVATLVVCSSGLAQTTGDDIRCEYKRKIECLSGGCEDGDVGSAYLLLPHVDELFGATIAANVASELPRIRRCDARGCSTVQVRASLNGAFVNVTQIDGTYFLKIAATDLGQDLRIGDFVEVASLMLGTITYFGSCPMVAK